MRKILSLGLIAAFMLAFAQVAQVVSPHVV
jgi:hypothetical protein